MASDYADNAKGLGGSCNEFVQDDFITAQGWGSDDTSKRKGGITTGKGLGNGCCSALSAMYLGSRGDWSVFKNIIVSPGGLAHVRGLQNLNIHAADVGSFNFDNIADVYKDVMKLFGVTYGGTQRSGDNSDAAGGALGLANQDGQFYFSFWGPWGGHTVALYRKDKTTKAFDPNYGEAILTADKFAQFVNWWVPTKYPGISKWFIQRYFL